MVRFSAPVLPSCVGCVLLLILVCCCCVCVFAVTSTVIPGIDRMFGNVLSPNGTLFLSYNFPQEQASIQVQGAHPILAMQITAVRQIQQQQLLGSRHVNVYLQDDLGNALRASTNLCNFASTVSHNSTGYGSIVGVSGSLGDIPITLAITSGSYQLAHTSTSTAFDFLNRQVYPYHLSSGPSGARIADSMMVFCAQNGWRHIALLSSLDTLGRSYRDYLVKTYSSSFVFSQETFSVSPSEISSTLDLALQHIISTENRILVIVATGTLGNRIFTALQKAQLLNNPRYIIIGQNWVTNAGVISWISQLNNVYGALPQSPNSTQVSAFLPSFSATLDSMNLTSAARSATMSGFYGGIGNLVQYYHSIYAMLYGIALVWNASLPITGPNLYQMMSNMDIQTPFTDRLRYTTDGYALADIAIAMFQPANRGFGDIRLLYNGVSGFVNDSTSASSAFRVISPLVFMDGTGTPPPDRPNYSLHMVQVGAGQGGTNTFINTYNNQTNPRYPMANHGANPAYRDMSNVTMSMSSGNPFPDGLVLVMTDQTGLIVPEPTIALWQQALNANPTINAYVTAVQSNNNSTGLAVAAGASVSGTPSVRLSSTSALAIADFSGLIVSARPGSTVYLHFECILPGGHPLESPSITINMADCPAGSYVDSKASVCQPCANGYDTRGQMNAMSCVPILHEITPGITITFIVLASIGIAIVAVVFGYVVKLALGRSRTIYHYSPTFCMITLIGMELVFASVVGMVINPVNSCTAQSVATWLFNIGFTWTFGAMFAKSYRLYKIFNNILLCMTAISNKQLYSMLAGLTAVDVILLAIWQGVDPYTLSVGSYRTCDSGTVGLAIKYILLAIKGSLLLCGMYLTHATRRVPSAFNEHKASTIAIYNASVIGVVIIGIMFGMKSSSGDVTISIVQATGAWIGALSTLCVIFGHLICDVYLHSVSVNSKGKKNQQVSGACIDAVAVFDDRHSSAHYSTLDALAQEVKQRNATCHGDNDFLDAYAKLQSIMKSLSTSQNKKNAILQKLAEICADKDYRRRCGEVSAASAQQQGAQAAQPPSSSIGIGSIHSVKDDASMEPIHHDRKMSGPSVTSPPALLVPSTRRSSVTVNGSGSGAASPIGRGSIVGSPYSLPLAGAQAHLRNNSAI